MCGIAGVVTVRPSAVSRADLGLMADRLAHRGPDGEGFWISADQTVGLAHRRLAIIDATPASDQPFLSGDGRFVIVFNGEIYNFLELREELERLGSVFRTEGDTEVVLEGWRHWGSGLFLRMNGMWALALHDTLSGETIFARDRFGVKPFYYATAPQGLAFASELRAFQPLAWIDRTPDLDVVRRTLFDPFSVEGTDRTLFRDIHRLPAGHYAVLRDGHLEVTRWWRTCDHLVEVPASDNDQAAHFRDLFFDATRLRMRSDVPIGTCLSGGFDSTAITSAISQLAQDNGDHRRAAGDWRHAFVASFPGAGNDETAEAVVAAEYAGIDPSILEISEQDALSDIDRILEDLDDVYMMLPTAVWQLYRNVRRQGVTVTLDGHGADELMGGYRQKGGGFSFHLRNAASALDTLFRGFSIIDTVRTLTFSRAGLQFLRGHNYQPPRRIEGPFDHDKLPASWGAFDRRLYRMFHATVLPTVLRNFDRMSMAHGIEVRMPFMDWRVVTYVMSLPDSAKLRDGQTKYVARAAMKGLMPEGIRTARRKVGFNSPMPEWMNGPLAAWTKALLATPNPTFEAVVDVPALRARIDDLTARGAWTWRTAEHLWPYIHMRWLLGRMAS